MSEEITGGGLDVTNINSDNNVVNPNPNPIVTDADNTNLTDDDLRYFTEYIKQNNVPPVNTTLPPDYYYPNRNKNVAIGQFSGALGSGNVYSPGAPLVPYSVLDAIDKQNEAIKQNAIKAELDTKFDINYSDITLLGLAPKWTKYQYDVLNGIINSYKEKYGSAVGAKKMLDQTGELKEKEKELSGMASQINNGASKANDIVNNYSKYGGGQVGASDTKGGYINKQTFDLANELLSLIDAGNFEEKAEEIYLTSLKLNQATSMSLAAETIWDVSKNQEVYQPMYEQIYEISGFDKNGQPLKGSALNTSITKTAQRMIIKGEGAFSDLDWRIEQNYNSSYSNIPDNGNKPTLKEFNDFVKAGMINSITYETIKIGETDAYNKASANHNINTKILSPFRIKRSGRDLEEYGLPSAISSDGKGLIIGGDDTKRTDLIGGMITSFMKDVNTGAVLINVQKKNGVNTVVPAERNIISIIEYYLQDNNVKYDNKILDPSYVTGSTNMGDQTTRTPGVSGNKFTQGTPNPEPNPEPKPSLY